MIQFRCWYCNKRYTVSEGRVGERIDCTCKNLLRVPKRSGGNSRVKTVLDWLVEITLYGGGGALLAFGLALLILSRWPFFLPRRGWLFLAAFILAGFLIGALGGERGLVWVGRMIRDRENR